MEKVIIVDDHPVVINGLRAILEGNGEYTVTGEAVDIDGAMELLKADTPDLMIIDIELRCGLSGIEFVRRTHDRFPAVRILVMSMDDGTLYAERAIKAGAKGFISKIDVADNIFNAIETVKRGRIYLSNEVCGIIAGNHFRNCFQSSGINDIIDLTDRELEIFQLMGRGYKRNEIAEKLNISVNTFEAHRRKIREKLCISSSPDLTRYAIRYFAERFNIQP